MKERQRTAFYAVKVLRSIQVKSKFLYSYLASYQVIEVCRGIIQAH